MTLHKRLEDLMGLPIRVEDPPPDEPLAIVFGAEPSVPGCRQVSCATCLTTGYIGPASQHTIERATGPVRLICAPCARAEMSLEGGEPTVLATPEVMDEVRAYLEGQAECGR